MTPIVTLDEAKLWCRVEIDQHDEDSTFELLVGAATAAVLDVADGWVPIEGQPVPDRLKLAVLTHVAQAYVDRENGAELPAGASRLVLPLRRLEV